MSSDTPKPNVFRHKPN